MERIFGRSEVKATRLRSAIGVDARNSSRRPGRYYNEYFAAERVEGATIRDSTMRGNGLSLLSERVPNGLGPQGRSGSSRSLSKSVSPVKQDETTTTSQQELRPAPDA